MHSTVVSERSHTLEGGIIFSLYCTMPHKETHTGSILQDPLPPPSKHARTLTCSHAHACTHRTHANGYHKHHPMSYLCLNIFYTYNYYHDCIHMLSSANTEAARPSHLPIGGVPWYVQDMYAPTMALFLSFCGTCPCVITLWGNRVCALVNARACVQVSVCLCVCVFVCARAPHCVFVCVCEQVLPPERAADMQ